MTRPISIRLPTEDRQALAELALVEYREVSDQAAYLIAEGLRHRGMLPDLKTAADHQSASAVTA
jgi:hypothetical protein